MANKDIIFAQEQADGSHVEMTITPVASEYMAFDGSKDPISAAAVDTTKLPLAGGTMSGSIAMGNFHITGVNNLCATTLYGDGSNLTGVGGGPIGWDAGTTCSLCTCIAGHNIASANSNCAAILGGRNHVMSDDAPNALIAGGNCNCLLGGTDASSIVGGLTNNIEGACYSFLGGGSSNRLLYSNCGVVVGGSFTCMYRASDSFIGGGYYNCIYCSGGSVVGGGYYNHIDSSSNSHSNVLGGGDSNKICFGSCYSGILSGRANKLCCSDNSFIIGSCISVSQKDCWAFMNNLCVDVGGGCLRACQYYAAGVAGVSGSGTNVTACNGIVTAIS